MQDTVWMTMIVAAGAVILTGVKDCLWAPLQTIVTLVLWLSGTLACVLALVVSDYIRRPKSERLTSRKAFTHYLAVRKLQLRGLFYQWRLKQMCQNCQKVQARHLLSRLEQCKDTVYGKDHNFAEMKTVEEFREKHPLTEFSYFQPYIDRVLKGEMNVLMPGKPYRFVASSGTTGRSKIIPMFRDKVVLKGFLQSFPVMLRAMFSSIPGMVNPQSTLYFALTPVPRYTTTGLYIGPVSYDPSRPHLKTSPAFGLVSTPACFRKVFNERSAAYIHLLFGLKDKNIGCLEALFVSIIYTAFKTLKSSWPDLVKDIENGTVSPNVDLSEEVRAELRTQLKPDPDRATEVKQECLKGFDGIALRLWPRLHLVVTTDSGQFELYAKSLRACECRGVPFFSSLYAATEGVMAFNLEPLAETRRYLVLPHLAFYEFIPIEHSHEEQPKTVLLHEVKDGHQYEVVVTSGRVYRNRFGDVVEVDGFKGNCPQLRFLHRKGQLLSLLGEKITEDAFYGVLKNVLTQWEDVTLEDYCCVESPLWPPADDADSIPYYVILMELSEGQTLKPEQKSQLDDALCELNGAYNRHRLQGGLRKLQVVLLQPETFRRLKQFMVDNTMTSALQFKVPRVAKRPEVIQFLADRVM